MCMLLRIWGLYRRLVKRAVLDGRTQQMRMDYLGLMEQTGNAAAAAEAGGIMVHQGVDLLELVIPGVLAAEALRQTHL